MDARVSRRGRGGAGVDCPLAGDRIQCPGIGFNFVRRQIVEVDTTPARGAAGASRCRRRRSSSSTRPCGSGAALVVATGLSQRLDAQGGARARSTCASSWTAREAGVDHDAQRRRLGRAPHRHLGARRPDRGGALRDHVAGAARAPLRASPRRRASEARCRLDVRRIDRDRLITAALALATVVWLLAVEGRQGFGRDEGQYFRAGERYWGWFEELGVQHRARPARAVLQRRRGSIATGATTRPITPSIMKTLYGLSWRAFHRCTLHGPDARSAPDPGQGPTHHAAAVRARVDRVSLPRDPVRGAAGRDGLPVRARVAVARRRPPPRPC